MDKKWRYIAVCVLVWMLHLPSAHAADEKKEVVLLAESYDEVAKDKINRFYQLADGSIYYMDIAIPKEIRKAVAASEDPLLEAKKQLATLYVLEKEEERLKELNNEYHQMFEDGTVYTITEKYEKAFASEKKESIAYAENVAGSWKERKKVPDVDFEPYSIQERQQITDGTYNNRKAIPLPVMLVLVAALAGWSGWLYNRRKKQKRREAEKVPTAVSSLSEKQEKGGENHEK